MYGQVLIDLFLREFTQSIIDQNLGVYERSQRSQSIMTRDEFYLQRFLKAMKFGITQIIFSFDPVTTKTDRTLVLKKWISDQSVAIKISKYSEYTLKTLINQDSRYYLMHMFLSTDLFERFFLGDFDYDEAQAPDSEWFTIHLDYRQSKISIRHVFDISRMMSSLYDEFSSVIENRLPDLSGFCTLKPRFGYPAYRDRFYHGESGFISKPRSEPSLFRNDEDSYKMYFSTSMPPDINRKNKMNTSLKLRTVFDLLKDSAPMPETDSLNTSQESTLSLRASESRSPQELSDESSTLSNKSLSSSSILSYTDSASSLSSLSVFSDKSKISIKPSLRFVDESIKKFS